MKAKNTFIYLFLGLITILLMLPAFTAFNAVITELVNKIGLYRYMQDIIVPFESKLVVIIIRFLGVKAFVAHAGDAASFYLIKGQVASPFTMQWNCLGWQSLILLFLSFLPGLQGNYTKRSIFEVISIGLLGTFLVNIFRMVFISLGLYYVSTVFALLIHDYFAAFVSILWLFFFWWFAYAYILEEKTSYTLDAKENTPAN